MMLGMEYLLGSAAVAGLLAVVAKLYVFNGTSTIGTSADQPGLKRRLSFSSVSMLKGAFPEKTHVCEPVINVLFYFKKVPTIEKLKEICDVLFFFDRFRSVVTRSRCVLFDAGVQCCLSLVFIGQRYIIVNV